MSTECPDCGSSDLGRHSIRKNKKASKVVFRCKHCKRIFTEDKIFLRMRIKKEAIVLALKLFNEGYTYGRICRQISSRFALKVQRSTVYRWTEKYAKIKLSA